MIKCEYSPQCGGCNNWDTPYSEQITNKVVYLQNLLKEKDISVSNRIEFISCGEMGLRHRIDFTIEYVDLLSRHKYGFYDKDKKLIHINNCLQLAPELQKIYSEFLNFKFFYKVSPVRKGSIRLRVGPEGIKGCWLDFSNIDIKHLLEDQKVLNEILDSGYIVEIGQKGKQLIRQNGLLKLNEPVAFNWMKTTDSNGNDYLLKCLISDFTQPSWVSAAVLVKQVLKWTLNNQKVTAVLEFGSGIGQFTLGFLKAGLTVDAVEINESALTHLNSNAHVYHLENNLTLHIGDYHIKKIPRPNEYDLAFVNPARSGLRGFTAELLSSNIQYLIYVSCFPESLAEDLQKLKNGYRVCNITIVDQFPQTKHFESCVLLKKLN